MSLLQRFREQGLGIRRGQGEQLFLRGVLEGPWLLLAKTSKAQLLQELVAEELALGDKLYACPRCGELDYQPLEDGRRLCLDYDCRCVYYDCRDDPGQSLQRPPVFRPPHSQLARLPCPRCQGYPYSPGPEGLPQRRCHGCDHVWNPLAEEKSSETTATT